MNFDRNACNRRNRIAARRDGINAAPVRFFRGEGQVAHEQDLASSWGKLPKGEAAVLAAINERCRPGTVLSADDVWWGYMEAANDSFIGDRYMFLDGSTLKNIAIDAQAGYAFMNSHRTGGMSTPTELPFGWTFAGRYEEVDGRKRCMVGVYMRLTNDKGEDIKPNGDSGPTARDLAAMIDGGTLPDVSVGLHSGTAQCDVCGEELDPYWRDDNCQHCPGTTIGMTEAEKKAQKGRGVPDGCATYSLMNARCGETSSVYDGAVTGAGFKFAPLFNGHVEGDGLRKALSLCRRSNLSDLTREELRRAYGPLLRDHDFSPREDGPISRSFAEHSQAVLSAVAELADRAEDYASLREANGKPLSSERRAEFERIHAALGRILAADKSPDLGSRLGALRSFALRQGVSLS